MPTIVHPVFEIRGMLKLNPLNHYIIDGVAWIKNGNPNDVIAAGEIAAQLKTIGIMPIRDTYEVEENKHKVYQVAILTHPTLGELRIGIVSGPDFEVIKQSLDPVDKIIEEKAQFKLNVHDTHETTQ